MNLQKWLSTFDVWEQPKQWFSGFSDAQKAWAECQNGDWMLYLLGAVVEAGSPDHKKLVLAACECASLTSSFVNNPPAKDGIELARQWATGKATDEEVRGAKRPLEEERDETRMSYDCQYAAEGAASWAAGFALDTCLKPNSASDTATYAAEAALYAGEDGDYQRILARCADICRQHFPNHPEV